MSDWEDMVSKVCVAGRPGKVNDLALDWQAVFYNARTVSQSLRDGMKDLQEKWKGPAADEYRKKIEQIASAIEDIEEHNKGIIMMLQTTSKALAQGQTDMPVPDYMLDEVQGRRAQLDAANDAGARALTGSALAVSTFGLSYAAAAIVPDSFMKPLADSFVGNWGRELFGHFTAWWDDWNGKMTAEAKKVYDEVDRSYGEADLMTRNPTPTNTTLTDTNHKLTFDNGPGTTNLGKTPHIGTGNIDPKSHGFDPKSQGLDPKGTGIGHGFTDPSIGSGGVSGHNPDNPALSSLAGAGGGLSGLGGGAGGLSGMGSGAGGLGSGGLGASGLGATVGRPVSPPAMSPMGMGGAGRGAGAGRGTGMMGGGGHGGGGHGSEDEHETWLTEDDDIWGGDSDAPPSVLN